MSGSGPTNNPIDASPLAPTLRKPRRVGQPARSSSRRYSLDRLFLLWNTIGTAWEVEFTDEFAEWWTSLDEAEQEDVEASVMLLRERGPTLGRPHADLVATSAYPNMKELRTQHDGRPYRTLFAFDPRRVAILLIGGDKTGNARWYLEFVPQADKIYSEHLRQLEKEFRENR
jgi:hypothetical protein